MLWTSASHAGFTTASSPWLPVHPTYHTANVEVLCSIYYVLFKAAVDEVEEFTYLGSIVSATGGTGQDVEARLGKLDQLFGLWTNYGNQK